MFPIADNIPSRRIPVVTYTLIVLNCTIFFLEVTIPKDSLQQLFYIFGVVPRKYTDIQWAYWAGLPIGMVWLIVPLITSMFLHAGWLHLIGNMWFLWIFGDNVEDRLGHLRFLAFYFLCGILSSVIHIMTNPASILPTVGASGAISGVLGAYFILYPLAMVIVMIPILFWPIFFTLPAFLYIAFWFFMQFTSGTISLLLPGDVGGVAWWAHIGGFVTGIILCKIFIPKLYGKKKTTWKGEYIKESAW